MKILQQIKRTLIKFSINRLKSIILNEVQLRHHKKLANLIIENTIPDGIHINPNEVITSLTDTTISDYESKIFKYDLKHDVLIRPKESEMKVIMEDIYG